MLCYQNLCLEKLKFRPSPWSVNSAWSRRNPRKFEDRISENGSSDSAPSSANTIYMRSGNSTKTVVSMMDQSGFLKGGQGLHGRAGRRCLLDGWVSTETDLC